MPLTTRAEVKAEILENLEQFTSTPYPEDTLREYAEGLVPIYYHEIITEWIELSPADSDQWQQYGIDEAFLEGGIIKLMSVDLEIYYNELYWLAWKEIESERAAAE